MEREKVGREEASKEPSKEDSIAIISHQASKLPRNYESLIYARFLRSLRFGNYYFKLIEQKTYFDIYHRYIETLLARPAATIKLAVLNSDHDVVFGWSLIEDNKLHYIHVQEDYRRQGIHKLLIPTSVDTITHITRKGIRVWEREYAHWKFNPFI